MLQVERDHQVSPVVVDGNTVECFWKYNMNIRNPTQLYVADFFPGQG